MAPRRLCFHVVSPCGFIISIVQREAMNRKVKSTTSEFAVKIRLLEERWRIVAGWYLATAAQTLLLVYVQVMVWRSGIVALTSFLCCCSLAYEQPSGWLARAASCARRSVRTR